ncbi:hypothetical protein [Methylosinus sp. LW4]|uniref:hypothetical protein n=1 Tax=Methylosinus sp. LW4 TaxID=136993 RepID=UPI000372EC16|nr:hypothetical protein [Methylosinus sp. LW4]
MSAIASAVGAILASILGAVFDALRGKRQDEDRVATHEEAAVAEAAEETSDVVAEIADARSALPGAAADAHELALRLRARKTGSDAGSAGHE